MRGVVGQPLLAVPVRFARTVADSQEWLSYPWLVFIHRFGYHVVLFTPRRHWQEVCPRIRDHRENKLAKFV
jgi:hypothetical protein